MTDSKQIKKQFGVDKKALFNSSRLKTDAFKLSVKYSLLVEEYLFALTDKRKFDFALVSSGSFCRRELSPASDIDIIFITDDPQRDENAIKELVTLFWDAGIEVSHTLRDFNDIENFIEKDITTFTQFFETRFLYGNDKLYSKWMKQLYGVLERQHLNDVLQSHFSEIKKRHKKYGSSPKVLEPNVKLTAGGLRDMQVVEWMYSFINMVTLVEQKEITNTEGFLGKLKKDKVITPREYKRLKESYNLNLTVRNLLHLLDNKKNDRFEFASQKKVAEKLKYPEDHWQAFMKRYFESAGIINRFSRTMLKYFNEQVTKQVSDRLAIDLDDDFQLKDNIIFIKNNSSLELSDILRAFYYRGNHSARFSENLRSRIIEKVEDLEELEEDEYQSSVFFREILKLDQNVGTTLSAMNEMGVLSVILKEFKELVGFFQPGVYHAYTADEHTLLALQNLERLKGVNTFLGRLFTSMRDKDILYLAILLHDIAKPVSVSGHEIIGAEIAGSVAERLGYDQEETQMVQFLVRQHLTMEQTAFRRNLNDPTTLDNFFSIFHSTKSLDMLYLLTYADLSAVNPAVWTKWKNDLLFELFGKTKKMLHERLSGEELLYSESYDIIRDAKEKDDETLIKHIESINDYGYASHFSQEEINRHVEEIEKGSDVSVFIKEENSFTNISIITFDSPSLLTRLCGSLAVNDLNIYDAKIFTRNDSIVIDSFNVTDFRSHKPVENSRYEQIENSIHLAVQNILEINNEFKRVKSKWRRLENRLFGRKDNVKIEFEEHDKYTILDVFSPDRIGLLYQITRKMNELGLSIYFAKIATQADNIVDSFYVLDRNNKKISPEDKRIIRIELAQAIEEIL